MVLPVAVVATVAVGIIIPGENGLKAIERGILWQIGIDAADAIVKHVIDLYALAHRVAVSKQGCSEGLGDDNRRRILCGTRIALKHPETEHRREIGLGGE